MKDGVVITGVGLISSLGLTARTVWEALCAGAGGIRRITGFDAGGFECRVAAQVHGLDPAELGIHPRDARIMDTHSLMLMKAADAAFRESGLDATTVSGEQIGFFSGMGMVDYRIDDLLSAIIKSRNSHGDIDYYRFFSEGYQEIYPLWPLSMLNNISFCQVAIRLDIRGENAVFCPHADSGAVAVAEAAEALIARRVRVALAGGVSEKVSPSALARAHLSGTLNTTDGDDENACRPFSVDRNGTVLGEGCGVIALELRSSADARGVPYRAGVTGYGASFGKDDGPCPTASAISRSMIVAMENAGKKRDDIHLIIANGDGTLRGDGNEAEAIRTLFSDMMDRLYVYSSKGALGNLYAGAPVVDIILGLYMLEQGVIPPALHPVPPDDKTPFNLTAGKAFRKKPACIMVNCQSYEGQSASIIIERVK